MDAIPRVKNRRNYKNRFPFGQFLLIIEVFNGEDGTSRETGQPAVTLN
jgi:hypothetical protein